MLKKALSFAIFAILPVVIFGWRTTLSGGERLLPAKQQTDTNFRRLVNQKGLLAMLYIGSEREWLVNVVRTPQKNQLSIYQMSFYRMITTDIFKKLFEYETVDIFQTAYTTIERDRLLTIWTTGSAHRLKIFALAGNAINEVLSVGWKSDPEFVHLTKDNELEILIPVDELPGRWPLFAERYQWNGKEYILVDKVAWEDRFSALHK